MAITTDILDISHLVREGPDSDCNMAWSNVTTTLIPIDSGVTPTNMVVGGRTYGRAQATKEWMVCRHNPPEPCVTRSVLSVQ